MRVRMLAAIFYADLPAAASPTGGGFSFVFVTVFFFHFASLGACVCLWSLAAHIPPSVAVCSAAA